MEQSSKHSPRLDEEIKDQNSPLLKGEPTEPRANPQYKEQEIPPNGSVEDVERFNAGE
jgi:hypothetical protein